MSTGRCSALINFWWFIIIITDPICLLGKWCVLFHKISFLLKFFQDPKGITSAYLYFWEG